MCAEFLSVGHAVIPFDFKVDRIKNKFRCSSVLKFLHFVLSSPAHYFIHKPVTDRIKDKTKREVSSQKTYLVLSLIEVFGALFSH